MQYRAIGVVRGTYVPSDPEQLTRGTIHTTDGSEIEAVVLGRVLTLMRRHLDLSIIKKQKIVSATSTLLSRILMIVSWMRATSCAFANAFP